MTICHQNYSSLSKWLSLCPWTWSRGHSIASEQMKYSKVLLKSNGIVGSGDFRGCNSWAHDNAPCHFVIFWLMNIDHACLVHGKTIRPHRPRQSLQQQGDPNSTVGQAEQTNAQSRIQLRLAEGFRHWMKPLPASCISSCLGLASLCVFFLFNPCATLGHSALASTSVFGHRILHFSHLFFQLKVSGSPNAICMALVVSFLHVWLLGPKRTKVAKHLSYKDCKKSSCHKLTTRPSSLLESVILECFNWQSSETLAFLHFRTRVNCESKQPHVWKPNITNLCLCFSMARPCTHLNSHSLMQRCACNFQPERTVSSAMGFLRGRLKIKHQIWEHLPGSRWMPAFTSTICCASKEIHHVHWGRQLSHSDLGSESRGAARDKQT